jgi:hypothetical protein
MSDELLKKIRGWLDKHGYPLEMQVASRFREVGFSVSSSEYYLDPDEGKPREIDVIAAMQTIIAGVAFQIAYTVECKSSKESPWVCFCPGHSQDRELINVGFSARHTTLHGRDLISEITFQPDETTNLLFNIPENHAYGVTNTLKQNGVDLPYRAISAARKAAHALVAHYDKVQAADRIWTVCIAFPLIVVDAPIFNCQMNNNSEMELSQTDSQTILRKGFDTYYSAVEIVAATTLKPFLKVRAKLVSDFLKNLEPQIPDTLRQLHIDNLAAGKLGRGTSKD